MPAVLVQNDLYARIKSAVVNTLQYWIDNPYPIKSIPQGAFYQRLQGCGGVYSQPDYDTDSMNVDYPCIMCVYSGLREEYAGGDTVSSAYIWPVGVMIVDNTGKGVLTNEGTYTGWRKDIADIFHQQKLFDYDDSGHQSLVQEVCGGLVTANLIFDMKNQKFLNVQSALLLKFEAWELG